jgi:hypothetical protein
MPYAELELNRQLPRVSVLRYSQISSAYGW